MTRNNFIMFSVLALSMIIAVSGTNTVWADHVDYVGNWIKIDKTMEQLYADTESLKEKIKTLEDKSSQQDVRTSNMIQQLKSELGEKSSMMIELDKELNRLEQLNIESFKVDPDTEMRFYSTEFTLLDKYVFTDSENYIGVNPVTGVDVDFQHRRLIINFDPEQVVLETDPAKSPVKIMDDIRILTGKTIPLSLGYAKPELIACASRTDVCDPIKAGVQVADTTNIMGNGTVMYKSTRNGNVGFVTAGHVSGPQGKIIEQPVNNRDVGVVDYRCFSGTCDFSFVKLNSGVAINSNSIYWTPTASWVITNKILDSSQNLGVIIKKSGVGTGNTVGTVYENNPLLTYNKAQIVIGPMDSGSPVFRQPSDLQNYVDLYGMNFQKQGPLSFYFPWDYIKTQLGLSE